MIEDPRPLVFALAKLGLSHSAIAATEAEIEALAPLHPARNTRQILAPPAPSPRNSRQRRRNQRWPLNPLRKKRLSFAFLSRAP